MFIARIIPNAKAFEVAQRKPNELQIRVPEKPVRGKANRLVEKLLSKQLNATVRIVKGFHSNTKTIQIGLPKEMATARLNAAFSR